VGRGHNAGGAVWLTGGGVAQIQIDSKSSSNQFKLTQTYFDPNLTFPSSKNLK
jgi:hypothetical protein